MPDYTQLNLISEIAYKLDRYQIKHRNPMKINFRCPLCGDSQKSKTKARGWLNEQKSGKFWYSCWNCGASISFEKFLKEIDPDLAKRLSIESFLNKNAPAKEEFFLENKKKTPEDPLKDIKKISQLPADHPAKQYVLKRKIPSEQHYRIYYAPKFKKWINTIIPGKFENTERDEPRLILPFFDEKKQCFGVNARSFDPKSNLRYISIMFKETTKIFGLDTLDKTKPYIIVEGPIDSLFLKNAVAMSGADINPKKLPEGRIWVFDNEPRSREIIDRMNKLLKMKEKVCIWPKDIIVKDINDMILSGMTNIEQIIFNNSHSGLVGELELAKWGKRDAKSRRYSGV